MRGRAPRLHRTSDAGRGLRVPAHTGLVIDFVVPPERFLEARLLLQGRVHHTPILASSTAGRVLAARGVALADGRLYAKAEHLQHGGSFKIRGALNRLASLTPAEAEAGVITLSAGNHAQGLALAAREAGVHAVVMMPVRAVRSKVEACRGYGAEVILFGDSIGETWAWMDEVAAERGLTFISPFDDPGIIAGQGTVGLEILDDLPEVDVIVVGIGGGALATGIAAAVKSVRPSVRVYGVEPVESNAISVALERGEPVTIQPKSVADGLNSPFAGTWTLAMARAYLDGVILLDDPTILAGVAFALERMKQLVEPAGAAALAATLFGRVPLRNGERVCVVLSGGNVETSRLGDLLAGAAPLEIPPEVAG
jgi:threonine dehydratase